MGYQERRKKLIADRAAPHLQPGEQIQTGFIAQAGSPVFSVSPWTRVWTIVVTDRAILVVRRGSARRLPRDVAFGAPTGVYHKVQLDRTYRVHRQYYPELAAADEALREMQSRERPAAGDH